MEHLAETMTDFLLRRKYITEEQTEWCHYMLIKNIMSIASLVLLLPLGALIAGFSCLSIALFGPANHPELHLSEKELKALQPRIYIRLLIVVALTAVLLFFRPDWGACTAFGVFAAALLLVISLQGYGAQ